MDDPTIRILIREKLKDGRLPHNSMPRFWGDPADGEICDACDKPITKQFASRIGNMQPLQVHASSDQI